MQTAGSCAKWGRGGCVVHFTQPPGSPPGFVVHGFHLPPLPPPGIAWRPAALVGSQPFCAVPRRSLALGGPDRAARSIGDGPLLWQARQAEACEVLAPRLRHLDPQPHTGAKTSGSSHRVRAAANAAERGTRLPCGVIPVAAHRHVNALILAGGCEATPRRADVFHTTRSGVLATTVFPDGDTPRHVPQLIKRRGNSVAFLGAGNGLQDVDTVNFCWIARHRIVIIPIGVLGRPPLRASIVVFSISVGGVVPIICGESDRIPTNSATQSLAGPGTVGTGVAPIRAGHGGIGVLVWCIVSIAEATLPVRRALRG